MGPVFNDTVFLLVFVVAVVVAMGPDIRREIRQRRTDAGDAKTRDRGSKRVIGVAGSGGLLAGLAAVYLVPSLTITRYPRLVFGVGVAILLLGGVIRQYAVRTLDDYFTSEVKIHDNQQVVDTGPYRLVRHPSYTGGLLEYGGIGLVLGNWVSPIAVVGPLIAAYVYRIRIEERALSEELGEPYQRFLDRTPYRLVPYVW